MTTFKTITKKEHSERASATELPSRTQCRVRLYWQNSTQSKNRVRTCCLIETGRAPLSLLCFKKMRCTHHRRGGE